MSELGREEATVNALVERLGMTQPQVSKHLGVLRAAGLVTVRPEGRRRYYRVNGPALKPVHEWVGAFSATWNERLDRLDDVVREPEKHRNEEES
jgi:DNA-binding transcriptional ArsR family regulator